MQMASVDRKRSNAVDRKRSGERKEEEEKEEKEEKKITDYHKEGRKEGRK